MTDSEADQYRKKVISLMFTNTNKGEKAPGHTIEADCSPRPASSKTVHPLSADPMGSSPKLVNQRDHLMRALPRTKPDNAAISYICQGTSLPRKFNKAAAIALGIKPGPVYGQLQKGISVTLDDGRIVTQEMVCDPEVPGHVFMVVDCPSLAYIDGLVNSDKFKSFQTGGTNKVNAIIHYVGEGVLQDARYKQWLHSFDLKTDVIIKTDRVVPAY
jgi:ribonuclease Z